MYRDHAVYAYLMTRKDPEKMSRPLVEEHVAHLKQLRAQGKLVICGPFLNYDGGMVVIRAGSETEARQTAEKDPFISSGFESYELRVWQLASEENNYLL